MMIPQRLIALGLASVIVTGGTLVAEQEGERLSSYIDPVGIITVCFGDTGPDVKMGQTYTLDECIAKLGGRLLEFNEDLLELTEGIELTHGEHAAYLSFIYNIGAGAFGASTLRKKLRAGDRLGACHELSRWVYAKKRKLRGLVIRREKEKRLCLRNLYVQYG